MTNAQFDALATLLRSRNTTIQHAARRVLVDGIRQADAARELNVRRDGLNNALRRYKRALSLAYAATT